MSSGLRYRTLPLFAFLRLLGFRIRIFWSIQFRTPDVSVTFLFLEDLSRSLKVHLHRLFQSKLRRRAMQSHQQGNYLAWLETAQPRKTAEIENFLSWPNRSVARCETRIFSSIPHRQAALLRWNSLSKWTLNSCFCVLINFPSPKLELISEKSLCPPK